jgi:glutamate-1-semialdehyde 2,1-aminomutase
VSSWGPLLFGHAHPRILEAVRDRIALGTTFGAPTELEIELAESICHMIPSCEKVRLVSSGTEAAMSAIRVARGFTGRNKVIKFDGCYHGHADHLLAKAGSGVATLGLPDSAGVPPQITADTITLPFNDLTAVEAIFAMEEGRVACVILEPVAGNMGCVLPETGFLEGLRRVTSDEGALLVFDEVITGFRLAAGGAQEVYGVVPDLTVLGKIMGGGMPLAAYGGRADIMDVVAPVGAVYQAGTLSGNPLAVAAGLETLRMIGEDTGLYGRLELAGREVEASLRESADRTGIPATVNRAGSMFTLFFGDGIVCDSETARSSDSARFAAFFRTMLEAGIYLPPSQYECVFLSTAMTAADLDRFASTAAHAFERLALGPQSGRV